MSKPVIRPALEFEWPKPMRPLINGLSKGLHSLAHAHQDDLLGFSVAHGVGHRYIGGAVSEYGCAFVATGDGRSCDGTIFRLAPQASYSIEVMQQTSLKDACPARLFNSALGNPGCEFETIHFADFTVVLIFDKDGFECEIDQIRIVATPARDAQHAHRRVTEIKALFAFLGEWHTTLRKYRFDLPTHDLFLRAA